jgi:two-component system, OmpR family, sensor kinase
MKARATTPMTFPRLRSLKYKLALLFFGTAAAAFAVIYLVVVPQLQSKLEDQRLREIRQVASSSSPPLQEAIGREITARELDRLVRAVADSAGTRVTLLGVQSSAETAQVRLYVISDSNAEQHIDPSTELAALAAENRRTEQGTGVDERGEEVGLAARPLYFEGRPDWVAVYSRSLGDVAETVDLVRNRIIAASLAALLVALVGGYLIAQAVARRVRRVESAARELAAGKQVDPLPVDSDDELGELTRAFNEMETQLKRVERARREFIANASHELRTPVFSLGGFVELLQDEQLDAETREEFLATMREQVERLGKLTGDLLDLSRLDAGSLELSPEEVDLSQIARDVVTEFTPALGEHGTELVLRLEGGGVDAFCDPDRAAQIMRILLDNALRHTPEGTPVTVTAAQQNGSAEFAVADGGPGIEAQDRLFERFYTADSARGSGLGLAIAKELAEHMSGQIRLSSRPGKTVFTLALPTSGDDAPT